MPDYSSLVEKLLRTAGHKADQVSRELQGKPEALNRLERLYYEHPHIVGAYSSDALADTLAPRTNVSKSGAQRMPMLINPNKFEDLAASLTPWGPKGKDFHDQDKIDAILQHLRASKFPELDTTPDLLIASDLERLNHDYDPNQWPRAAGRVQFKKPNPRPGSLMYGEANIGPVGPNGQARVHGSDIMDFMLPPERVGDLAEKGALHFSHPGMFQPDELFMLGDATRVGDMDHYRNQLERLLGSEYAVHGHEGRHRNKVMGSDMLDLPTNILSIMGKPDILEAFLKQDVLRPQDSLRGIMRDPVKWRDILTPFSEGGLAQAAAHLAKGGSLDKLRAKVRQLNKVSDLKQNLSNYRDFESNYDTGSLLDYIGGQAGPINQGLREGKTGRVQSWIDELDDLFRDAPRLMNDLNVLRVAPKGAYPGIDKGYLSTTVTPSRLGGSWSEMSDTIPLEEGDAIYKMLMKKGTPFLRGMRDQGEFIFPRGMDIKDVEEFAKGGLVDPEQ